MSTRSINPGDLGAMDSDRQNPVMKLNNGFEAFLWKGRARIPAGTTVNDVPIIRFDTQRSIEANRELIIFANSLITSLGFYFDDDANGNRGVTLGAGTGKLKLAASLTANTTGLFLSSPPAVSNVLANIPFSPTLANGVWNVTPVSVGSSNVTYRIYATDGNATEGSVVASTATVANRDLEIIVWVGGFLRHVPAPNEVNRRNEGILW